MKRFEWRTVGASIFHTTDNGSQHWHDNLKSIELDFTLTLSGQLRSTNSWDLLVTLCFSASGMFCFCLQSSLLKLQALEVDGGPSLAPSPEESPPALGSKDQKSPCSPVDFGGLKDGKTIAMCHSADENSPPGKGACLSSIKSHCDQGFYYGTVKTTVCNSDLLTPFSLVAS